MPADTMVLQRATRRAAAFILGVCWESVLPDGVESRWLKVGVRVVFRIVLCLPDSSPSLYKMPAYAVQCPDSALSARLQIINPNPWLDRPVRLK